MTKLRSTLFVVVILALLCAGTMPAQTVANLSIVSGNGQLIGGTSGTGLYQAMVVKATDASGNPVANAVVSWTVVHGQGFLNATIATDATGQASNTYFPSVQPYGNVGLAYVQDTITATVGSLTTTFTETYGLIANPGGYNLVQVDQPTLGADQLANVAPLSGQSGTQGSTPILVSVTQIFNSSNSVPNVAVRLVSNQSSPTILCATGANADPGSVLTNAAGSASCTPLFGGAAGNGTYYLDVGGVANGTPTPYRRFGPYQFTVSAPAPGTITKISGDKQSANAGQGIAAPLVAKVGDASGGALNGVAVTWTVSPAGAATLTNVSNSSDTNGRISANVTFTASASGTVSVTVTVTGSPSTSTTFTETAIPPTPPISQLLKISGDGQSAQVNTAFPNPLVVQVNNSQGNPVSNVPVQFAVSGGLASPASLLTSTQSSGQAQMSLTAGPTTGDITVTATAGTLTPVTFTLHITPTLAVTASSFYNGVGYQPGQISPCSIATIVAPGIAPGIQGVIAPPMIGPLPTQMALGMAGTVLKITIGNTLAPIYSVANVNGQQQATIQIPCEVGPGNTTATVQVGNVTATVGLLFVQPVSPGIFTFVDTDGVARAVLTRPTGEFVTAANPARRGELIRAYVTGLGPATPPVGTNNLPVPGVDSIVQGSIVVGVTNAAGQGEGVQVTTAKVSPDLIGVYEVTFVMPSDAATGSTITFSIGIVAPNDTKTYYGNPTKTAIN